MARFKKTDKMDALGGVPLFSDLSKKDLGFLAQLTTEVSFPAGTDLVTQGDLGREAMVLMAGSAVVRRNGRKIAELNAGDVLGEMSLINTGKRNATVTAASDVKVLVMDAREFSSILSANTAVSNKVLRTVAARLVENQTNI